MRLYHGTSTAHLPGIACDGIRPRGFQGVTNWAATVESNPDTVYLTEGYGPLFAFNAAAHAGGCPAIVEVETDAIDSDAGILVPDEDAFEQATRTMDPDDPRVPDDFPFPPVGADMYERTQFYRDKALSLADFWPGSLETLGTCGVYGFIPVDAIRRVAVLHQVDDIRLMATDVSVTVMSHKVSGCHQKNLTRAIFGDFEAIESSHVGALSLDPSLMQSERAQVFIDDPSDLYRNALERTHIEVVREADLVDRFAPEQPEPMGATP